MAKLRIERTEVVFDVLSAPSQHITRALKLLRQQELIPEVPTGKKQHALIRRA